MNLGDYCKEYLELSGKASEINRTLILSGIAIVWMLKSMWEQEAKWVHVMALAALGVFCASLIIDLLQYLLQSKDTYNFYCIELGKGRKESDEPKQEFDGATYWRMWWSKFIMCGLAYVMLLIVFIAILS